MLFEINAEILNEGWDSEKQNFDLEKIVIDLEKMVRKDIGKQYHHQFKEEVNDSNFIKNLKLFARGCDAYVRFLNVYTIKGKTWNIPNSYQQREIIKMGTSLLFQLRKFLTGEQLLFVLGGTTPEGELRERTYNQNEIFGGNFTNLHIYLKEGEVQLANKLEDLNHLGIVESDLSHQWKDIINYGFVTNYERQGSISGTYKKNGKQYTAYQKKIPDLNVYYRWITENKKKQISYYYDITQKNPSINDYSVFSSMLSYDRGWLYQWGKTLEHNNQLWIDKGSLRPLWMLFASSYRENVPGIKGGDYLNEQYKHQNRTIITLTNIKDILNGGKSYNGIIPNIKKFLTTIDSDEKIESFSNILGDFTEYNEDMIKSFVSKELSELLSLK